MKKQTSPLTPLQIGERKAFTLVELIVVITILAILGAIAFISLQGYSKDARDVKRISDVRNLLTKINVEQSVGTPLNELITEDRAVRGQILGVENVPFQTMGKIDFTNLNENPNDFKDPDNTKDYYFAYAIGQTGSGRYNFIQGMAITETQGVKISGNYYTTKKSDIPSLFMEGGKYYEEGGEMNNGGEKSIADKTTEEILTEMPDKKYDDQLPSNACAGCKDILIGDGSGSGYIIRDRNEGATEVYNGEEEPTNTTWQNSPAYWGNYYQWGRNIIEFTIGSATYLDLGYAWIEKDKGPCLEGYHVPSRLEWDGLYQAWCKYRGGNDELCNSTSWSTPGPGIEVTLSKFKEDFKIPLASSRRWHSGNLNFPGTRGNYWSSSSATGSSAYGFAYYLSFSSYRITHAKDTEEKAHALSVRCFKN